MQWLYDVAFFSTNLLLCMLSSQLYQIGRGRGVLNGAAAADSPGDLFLQYLCTKPTRRNYQNQPLPGMSDHASHLTGRVVRALLLAAVDPAVPRTDSAVGYLAEAHRSASSQLAVVLPRLYASSKGVAPPQLLSRLVLTIQQSPLIISTMLRDVLSGSLDMVLAFPLKAWTSLLNFTKLSTVVGVPLAPKSSGGDEDYLEAAPAPAAATTSAPRQLSRQPLADRSLALLGVLLYNRRSGLGGNPFLEAFGQLQDEEREGDATVVQFGSPADGRTLHVDMALVAAGLARGLPGEGCALLLYALIQHQPSFVHTLHCCGQLPAVLCGTLRGLYEACGEGSAVTVTGLEHLYVLAVCVLLLVQDASVRSALAQQSLTADWYLEAAQATLPLLDLVLLCVLRVTLFSAFRLGGDRYLLTHSAAIVLNIAPQLRDMHPYTAERLVSLLTRLGRRVAGPSGGPLSASDSQASLDRCAACDATRLSRRSTAQSEQASPVDAAVSEALLTLLQLFLTALRPQRRSSNIQLLYSLIRKSKAALQTLRHPAVAALLPATASPPLPGPACHPFPSPAGAHDGSAFLVDEDSSGEDTLSSSNHSSSYYSEAASSPLEELGRLVSAALQHLEAAQMKSNYLSATNAVAALRRFVESGLEDSRGYEDPQNTLFSFEEGADPEAFFVPFAWACAVRAAAEMSWHLNAVGLFDPFALGLLLAANPVEAGGDLEAPSGMDHAASAEL